MRFHEACRASGLPRRVLPSSRSAGRAEYMHGVAPRAESLRELPGVLLGPRGLPGRVPMDELQDAHGAARYIADG